MINLNYHHLYYFYSVAKAGSIAKARETLLLSQPTISAQLKELSSQLSCRLFERQGRGLRLTEEGRFVLDYAESIFSLGDELRDSLRDRKPGGKVSVQLGVVSGTPRSFSHHLVEEALASRPGVHVQEVEGSLESLAKDLREHRLDLVLSDRPYSAAGHEQLTSVRVGSVPVVFAASPRLARGCGRTPADLARLPWILPSAPSRVYHQVLELVARWRIAPDVVAEVQDLEVARRLVLAGRGIAPLNAYTLAVSLPARQLVQVGPRRLGISEAAYLLAAKRRWSNPVAAALLKGFRLPSR
ncbi:MAG: LysR family transcriptional regulator [Elusimicrobiota bacterium]|nr:LysR family transcriptional regulator [Elusimicrobiota bacterium]